MISAAILRKALAFGVLTMGCATAAPERSAQTGDEQPVRGGSAIVIDGAQMQGRGLTLLRLLSERVTGMSVNYSGPCPSIAMRGTKSLFGSNDPLIYIDGARALNTCVLDDLSASIVKRVEVYPSGVAQKPGYDSSRNGLILVFVVDGREG
jgi:hypothetical protein